MRPAIELCVVERHVKRGDMRTDVARLIGQVGVTLVLLLQARSGGAAADCWGKWHVELARPDAEKEAWVSPDSWCRGMTLPRNLDLDVRRSDAGGVSVTGTPLRPSDVLVGAGKCTFEFSGSESHVPPDHELTIEVAVDGSSVHGTARCSQKTPGPNGRKGMAIGVAVTGSVAAEAASASVDTGELVAGVTRACERRDADALWKMSSPRFQAANEERAAQIRAAVSPSDLRRLFGFRGRPETFTGLAFLRYAAKTDRPAENPCTDAARWKVEETAPLPDRRSAAIRRPNGLAFGVTFVRGARGWQLDEISKSVPTKR